MKLNPYLLILLLTALFIFLDHTLCKGSELKYCSYINWLVVEIIWTIILVWAAAKISNIYNDRKAESDQKKHLEPLIHNFHGYVTWLKVFLGLNFYKWSENKFEVSFSTISKEKKLWERLSQVKRKDWATWLEYFNDYLQIIENWTVFILQNLKEYRIDQENLKKHLYRLMSKIIERRVKSKYEKSIQNIEIQEILNLLDNIYTNNFYTEIVSQPQPIIEEFNITIE